MCRCSRCASGASNEYETFEPSWGGEFESDFEDSEWEAESLGQGLAAAMLMAPVKPKTPVKPQPTAKPKTPVTANTPAKPQTLPQACGAEHVTTVAGVKFWRLKGDKSAFFFEAGMTIDADGAPNAYHPDSALGLDRLSNAGSKGNWVGVETDNGREDGNPLVQVKGRDPFPGFYISRTRLQDRSPNKSLVERQVDARIIPYIVLPYGLRAKFPNLKLGDFAFVIKRYFTDDQDDCPMSPAIFADTKETHVGEGSIALAKGLGIPEDPRTGGTDSGIIYIVFPGSGNTQPRPLWEINTKGVHLYNNWAGKAKLHADCFQGCHTMALPSSTKPGGQQEWLPPGTWRSEMRYDVNFEAEPFRGNAEFDEFEWAGELGYEGEVSPGAGLPGVVSRPYPQRATTTTIRCPPGVTKACPAIPNMLKVTSVNGVGFEYVLEKGGIVKDPGGLWVVKKRNKRDQNFTPDVAKALAKFLADMARFGMPVEAILSGGSFYCRCISKRNALSNHSFGDALDVVGLRWKSPSGVRETIVHNYANPQERAILRRINACLRLSFATVIDYHRSDHRDHFHCDTNQGKGGNPLGSASVVFIREALNLVLKQNLPEERYRKLDVGDGLSRVSGRTRAELKDKNVLRQTVNSLFTRVAQG